MSSFLFVGLGGAVGSMLRYGVSRIPFRGSFPVATLLVNLLGAVLIGYVTGMARSRQAPENLVLFLKTGVCGGFTTFSTFSLEAFTLLQNGKYLYAGLYLLLSVWPDAWEASGWECGWPGKGGNPMAKENWYRFLGVIGFLLLVGFAVQTWADLIQYSQGNMDPTLMMTTMFIRAAEFILPAIALFIAALLLKRKFRE